MENDTSTRSAAAHLLANRVPSFAGTWLVIVALSTLIETLQGRLRLDLALMFLVLHVAIVSGAVVLRSTAHARTIVIALCGGLAASITGTFTSFGGSAEILGAVLFALSASAAVFFVWGWRPQLALNTITAAIWFAALPHLGVSALPLELVGVTILSWVITLGLAESLRRTFHASLRLRAREQEAIEALQTSYDAYRDLAENARDFIWTSDLQGHLTYVNQATARVLGDTPNALVGRATAEFLTDHPGNVDAMATFARVGGGETIPPLALEWRTAIGRRWFEIVGTRIRDRSGRVVGVRVIGRDVTERHAAEEALHRSLADLRRSEETLRRLARRQAAIREEERRRLGLDLHDNVCQELAAIGVLLEVSRTHEHDSSELTQATRHLAEVIEHLRLVSRELRPMMLSDLGLVESLRTFAANASSLERRVAARFPTSIPRLGDETEVAIYRIAQESLGNALRHAEARNIDLLLRIDDGVLLLEVRDDGRGFDRTVSRTDSLGLASMEERALALGGRLEIASSPGRGTCVRLQCPVTIRNPATAA